MSAAGFVMVRGGGRNTPRLVCERCGEVIDDAGMAGVAHTREDGPVAVRVLCKVNHCLSSPEFRCLPWMELRHFLVYLLHNSGIKTVEQFAEAVEQADMLALTG